LLGNGVTYADQLHIVGKQLLGDKFLGVFPSDRIDFRKVQDKARYLIFNVDKSGMTGSHWMALGRINGKKNTKPAFLVYDSFGRPTKRLVPHLVNKGGRVSLTDTEYDPEQKLKEENCGARSLAWLIYMDKYGATKARKI
jgi:hypothetical protein